jgi:hypothetical protein
MIKTIPELNPRAGGNSTLSVIQPFNSDRAEVKLISRNFPFKYAFISL